MHYLPRPEGSSNTPSQELVTTSGDLEPVSGFLRLPVAQAYPWDSWAEKRPAIKNIRVVVFISEPKELTPEATQERKLLDDNVYLASGKELLEYGKREGKSICVWENAAAAKAAVSNPIHCIAADRVREFYHEYWVEVYDGKIDHTSSPPHTEFELVREYGFRKN